jgi:cobalt-zinc-cadmium efflux system protein
VAGETASPHGHTDPDGDEDAASRLGLAFWIVLALAALEAAGGWRAHSLALLGDAGHMLADVGALGLAWYASRLAHRAPTPRRTYGFHRAGILAALCNAALLFAIAAAVLVEAGLRLRHPAPVAPGLMSAVAVVALAGNLFAGLRLDHRHGEGHGPHRHRRNLNLHSARLHVMGDAAASLGVLVAAGLVALTHRTWWDPLVSAAIALGIARSAWIILRNTVNVLMEGTPHGIDPEQVAAAIAGDRDVLSVHHVHVWSLDGTRTALSGHVVMREDTPLSHAQAVVARLGRDVGRRFGITHTTLQAESPAAGSCPSDRCGPQQAEAPGPHGAPRRESPDARVS